MRALSLRFLIAASLLAGVAHAETALVQPGGGIDYRYDSTAGRYYFDADQDGSHDPGEQYAEPSIIDASDYASIQAAVDACGRGSTTKQGCIVRIPYGTYAQNVSIGGLTHALSQYGVTLEGVGAGQENNVGGDICAVTLTGNGAADNTIVTIEGAIQVTLRNFCIDGDEGANPAKYGVQIAPTGGVPTPLPTRYVTLQDMTIEDVTASGGFAISLGNGASADVPFATLERLILKTNSGCVLQDSQQAVANIVRNVECTGFSGPEAYLIKQGQLHLEHFYVAPSFDTNAAPQDGIVYRCSSGASCPLGAMIESGTFEWNRNNGTLIDFEQTGGSAIGFKRASVIKNVRFQPQVTASSRHVCIDWNWTGSLVVSGSTFENSVCEIDLNNAQTTTPYLNSYVLMQGNNVNFYSTWPSDALTIKRSTAGGPLTLRRIEMGLDQTCTGTAPCTSALATLRKAADQSNNTTTFAADDTLKFPVSANAKYSFRFVVFYDTSAAQDFKFELAGPASPAILRYVQRRLPPGTDDYLVTLATSFAISTSIASSFGTGGYLEIEGTLQNGANAGSVALRWAENSSGAGPTIVRAGSYLEFTQN